MSGFWSAGIVGGGAIPDTVVTQFDASTFSTADPTWSDDVGANDMSISGDPQSSTLSNGNPSVEGDGTDDYGLFSLPAELSGASLNNFALEFDLQHTLNAEATLQGVLDGQRLRVLLNRDSANNNDPGNIWISLKDGTDQVRFTPDTNPGLNDGNRHTVVVNFVDASINDVNFIIDGNNTSVTYESQTGPSSFSTWSRDMAVFARNNSGSIESFADVGVGILRYHDQDISTTTI